jgi:hypothetical protein
MGGNNITIANILNELTGQGVVIQNFKLRAGGVDISTMAGVTQNNARQMYGRYTYAGTAHPLTKGMILSTGNVSAVAQPSGVFANGNKGFGGDPKLIGTNFDAVAIEFDIYPMGYELKFNYTFASEEYDDYVCTPFNDDFKFLVTGPKPGGGIYNNVNIAVVHGTPADPITGDLGKPVTINNVNMGGPQCTPTTFSSHPEYFDPLGSAHMVFDQRTKNLQAKVPVLPAQKYTLYLVVADRRDAIFDTGVFIESIRSDAPYIVFPPLANGLPEGQLHEGTEMYGIKIKRNASFQSESVKLKLKGTATYTNDYELYEGVNLLASNEIDVPFAIGETEKNYILKIKTDNTIEQNETVIFELTRPNAVPSSDVVLQTNTYTIIEPFNGFVTQYNRCSTSENLEIEAPLAESYFWDAPANSYTCEIGDCRKIAVTSTTPNLQLTLKLGYGGTPAQNSTVSQVVTVTTSIMQLAPVPATICAGNSVQLLASGRTSYQWSPATGLSCTDCANPIASPSVTTTYTVSGITANCTVSNLQVTIMVIAPTETLTISNIDNFYCVANTATITPSASPAGGQFFVNGQSATNFSPSVLGAGIHKITYQRQDAVSNCLNSISKSIEVINAGGLIIISAQPASIGVMPNTQATFTVVATGKTKLAYQWQEDAGAGFVNLTDGVVYSGVNTATLALPNAPLSHDGRKYRCVLNDCGMQQNSQAATLVVSPLSISKALGEQIELYPNPFQNYVWLKTSLSIQAVELLDNAGKTLQQITVNRSQEGQYELIIKELSKGCYKLKIWVGKDFIIKDLVKE